MEKIVALCKRRGFVFPASEIYGGIANTYDYGHYGVLLKRNVIDEWWRAMVFERDDIVALDSAIIQHPRTWEASGHLAGFTDPLVDCRTCKLRFRADHLEEARAGAPGREELRCGVAPSKLPGRGRSLRPHGGAPVQPDVRDDDRAGEGRRLDGLPAPGDRAGHLPRLQDRAHVRPPAPAVRDRPGRQVVPQRDHAGQLRLPHARVRADGDGVLRPARRGAALVRVLAPGALGLVHAAGDPARPPAAARARPRRALALLLGHQRRRVPVPDRLAGARGHRQPRRLRPHRSTPTTPGRSSSTRTRRPARASSRT